MVHFIAVELARQWTAAAGRFATEQVLPGSVEDLHDKGNASWFAGFDPRQFAGGYPEAIAAAGGDAWFMYYRDCTQEVHGNTHRFGLQSAAWSVNLRDERELARLVRVGVDSICLDYPDVDLDAWRRGG